MSTFILTHIITLCIFYFAASKILSLNPVTALLSRRHMDLSFEHALKQTITSPVCTIQPDVPLSLLPDITPGQLQTVNQHGAILQLPPRPQFSGVEVATNTISLDWEVQDQNMDVSSDRTVTFSLYCYGDIPNKSKSKLAFKKKLTKMITPESGFDEMSELSSESNNTFPSLPPSLMGSRNISLMAQQNFQAINQGGAIREEAEEQSPKDDVKFPALILKPTGSKNITSLIPEPIRLPKTKDESTALPQLVGFGPPTSRLGTIAKPPPTALGTTSGGGVLNLPPLVVDKQDKSVHLGSLRSVNTSGVFGGSEDGEENSPHMSTVDESEHSEQRRVSHTDSASSSSSISLTSTGSRVTEYTDLGRFCEGYAFEEIYCGEERNYLYSGAVTGASYYFKVRCHNAAGWGPWSDTVQCTTKLH